MAAVRQKDEPECVGCDVLPADTQALRRSGVGNKSPGAGANDWAFCKVTLAPNTI